MSFVENVKKNLQDLFIVAAVVVLFVLDFFTISWALSTNNWFWYVIGAIVLGLAIILLARKSE